MDVAPSHFTNIWYMVPQGNATDALQAVHQLEEVQFERQGQSLEDQMLACLNCWKHDLQQLPFVILQHPMCSQR